jgi:S-disulfanyl-L-cysteine oxidoreductase SoxD
MIENGISPSGMPSSKGILDDEEIWSTVLFIRHLPPMGSVGEPEKYGK